MQYKTHRFYGTSQFYGFESGRPCLRVGVYARMCGCAECAVCTCNHMQRNAERLRLREIVKVSLSKPPRRRPDFKLRERLCVLSAPRVCYVIRSVGQFPVRFHINTPRACCLHAYVSNIYGTDDLRAST